MKIKICFNNETHRLTKLPETFESLSQLITAIFLTSLPPNWILEYIDSEGDKIMLADQQDYLEFINSEVKTNLSGRAVKVYIVPKPPMEESQALSTAMTTENTTERQQEENSQSMESTERSEADNSVLERQQVKAVVEEPVIQQVVEVEVPKVEAIEEKIAEDKVEESVKEEEALGEQQPVEVKMEVPEIKVEQVQKPVTLIENKVKAKNEVKNVPKKIGAKKQAKKKQQPIIISKPAVQLGNGQDLEELVNKAVEKNIQKIAMMTQAYLAKGTLVEEQTQTISKTQQVVHDGVTCNGCGMQPIVGIRYKCSVSQNFDFCERCEEIKEHPYAFIRIKFPGQTYSHAPKMIETCVVVVKPEQVPEPVEEKIVIEEDIVMEDVPLVVVPQVREQQEESKESPRQEPKPEPHEKSDVVVPTVRPQVKRLWEKVEVPKYSRFVMAKAAQLKQLLPEVNYDMLLAFVAKAPEDLDLVELMENFRL